MKKIFVWVLLTVSLLVFTTSRAHAIATSETAQEHAAARDDYKNGTVSLPVHLAGIIRGGMWEWLCLIGDARPCTNDTTEQHTYYQNSVMGTMSNSIAFLYTKPATTSDFIAYYGEKLAIVKPANAQGIGFAGLSPLLPLWRVFRNIAYFFLILVLVAVGFMIMFRRKIDPRTVISVQNALPRIILAVILIAFSYAIVGLMIDLMYLVIVLSVAVISTAVPQANLSQLVSFYTGGNLWSLGGAVFTTGTKSVDELSNMLGGALGNQATTLVISAILGKAVGLKGGILSLLGGEWAAAQGYNPLVLLFVWLALLFAFIRILFALVNAYIQIIVSLIFGPLQIMFDAIPNTNAFSAWFRNLLANLAVFPLVMIMLLIATIVSDAAANTANLWRPPGLAGNFVGAGLSSGVAGIIALGMLFLIPDFVKAIKELLKVKPVIPVGAGAIVSPLTAPISTGWSMLYQASMISHLLPGKKPSGPIPQLPGQEK